MFEIGEKLKAARLEKGYTLDDLQQITKIQKRYLNAIEEGNLKVLPGTFYARAFIKQYSEIVGLDGDELLAEYEEEVPEVKQEEIKDNLRSTRVHATGKTTDTVDRLQESMPTILIVLLVLAIIVTIYFAWRKTSGSNDEETLIKEDRTEQTIVKKDSKKSDEQEKDDDDQDAEEDSEDDEKEEEKSKDQSVELKSSTGANSTFKITGDRPEEQSFTLRGQGGETWVSLETDDGQAESGLLTDGQEFTITFGPNVNQIYAVIGNAEATVMELGGEKIDYPAEAAGVIRQEVIFEIE